MKSAVAAMLASLSVAGCAATSPLPVVTSLAPADPALALTTPSYEPVTAGYRHREPVDPKDWRKLNRDLAPAPKAAEEGAGS